MYKNFDLLFDEFLVSHSEQLDNLEEKAKDLVMEISKVVFQATNEQQDSFVHDIKKK